MNKIGSGWYWTSSTTSSTKAYYDLPNRPIYLLVIDEICPYISNNGLATCFTKNFYKL